jgi:hypothetical protein
METEKSDFAPLTKLSRLLAWVAVVIMAAYPIGVIVGFLVPGAADDTMSVVIPQLCFLDKSAISLPFRLGALAFALFSVGFVEWALYATWRLLSLYGRADVLSPEALRWLKQIGVALFASVVVDFALRLPISAILSWPLGAGHRFASMSFGSNDVLTLFAACVILVISRVMGEARRIAGATDV